jgi:signal transduction histidine kinase
MSPDLSEGLPGDRGALGALRPLRHAYARLARLPRPDPAPVDVASWVRCGIARDAIARIEVAGGPDATLLADGDQMEALLSNPVRNAADAALEAGGGARARWEVTQGWLTLRIEDQGPGIADASNLFVPFYTTKPEGTGIGLTLCRQIAEAHGGAVALANRLDERGCVATVRLPLRGPAA